MGFTRHADLAGADLHGARVVQRHAVDFAPLQEISITHPSDQNGARIVQVFELVDVNDGVLPTAIDPASLVGVAYIDPNDPNTVRWNSAVGGNAWGESFAAALVHQAQAGRFYFEASAQGAAPDATTIDVSSADGTEGVTYEYWNYGYTWGTRLGCALDADSGHIQIFKDQQLVAELYGSKGKTWIVKTRAAGTSNVYAGGAVTFYTDPADLLYPPPAGFQPGYGPPANVRQRYVPADPANHEVVIENATTTLVRRIAMQPADVKINVLV